MPCRRRNCLILAAFTWTCWHATPSPADEAGVQKRAKRILEVGWDKSIKALEQAEKEYESAGAGGDARLPYAMALVRIKHRKYKEAAKLLEEAVEAEGSHLPSRIARIWTDVLLKKYEASLVQMEQLAGLMRSNEDTYLPAEVQAQHLDAARFLGRTVAYLEGPAQSASIADNVSRCKENIWTGLNEDLQVEFSAGHAQVFQCYSDLASGSEIAKKETKAEQEKQKMIDAENLARERELIAERSESLQEQAKAAREELDGNLREIDAELAPLEAEYARLDSIASSLRSQIAGIDGQIGSISAACHNQCKGHSSCHHSADIARLNGIIGGLAADLRSVQASGNQISARGNVLYQQRDNLINQYNAEAKKLGREQVSLGKKDKRFRRDQQKNAKAPTGNSAKVRNLTDKARSFTTCNPFPLDKAKFCALDKPAEMLDPYRALLMSIGRLPEESKYRVAGGVSVSSRDSVVIQQSNRRAMW